MGIIRAKKPIAAEDLPALATLDPEAAAIASNAIANHIPGDPHPQYLLPSEADARYFRGIMFGVTTDLPSIGAGALEKIFYNVPGANVGNFCQISPVNVNLFAVAAWPFVFGAVIEQANLVGVYFRNDHTSAINLPPIQFKVFIVFD